MRAIGVIRPNFLTLALFCGLLAWSCVLAEGHNPSWWMVTLAVLAAILSHAAVNAFNEVADFKSGLDLRTKRTPFSGGSGTLPASPDALPAARVLAWATLLLTIIIGLWFVYHSGLQLLIYGLLGVVLIVFYTQWITRRPLLCLLAPGIGFGPIMIAGAGHALAGEFSPIALWASIPVFFLVSNLLLLNQLPDIEADRSVNRDHLPLRYGTPAAVRLFALFMILAPLSLLTGVLLHQLPLGALGGLLPLPAMLLSARGALRSLQDPAALKSALILNVVANNLTPLAMFVGMLLYP